jgi:hypothetical protein
VITDKERHEVANKLRERTKHKLAKGESMQHMFSETLGVYRTYDYGAFGLVKESATWKNIVNLLADLIDRPTTTRHGKFKTKYGRETPCCEVCGYSIGDMRWNHCPKCGAAIVDD